MSEPERARRQPRSRAERLGHGDCELVECETWSDMATSAAARVLRHSLFEFLRSRQVSDALASDVVAAAGEALANAAEHAFRGRAVGRMAIDTCVCFTHRTIALQVRDSGAMLPRTTPREGGGFGFAIIRALADTFSVRFGTGGTVVAMSFRLDRPRNGSD
jgi:anti-sigma regulatory factor (Ser/Thr protein kinase)